MTQVATSKASSLPRILQVMQTAAEKSCVRACQLFCLPLCDRFTWCSAPTLQPQEEKNIPETETLRNPPSTIMIVNISNSTLIDCVIGDSIPSAVAECDPLIQGYELQKHAQARCSCSHGQQGEAQTNPPPPPPCPSVPSGKHPNISIHSSRLNYVIIGDNNNMHVECNRPFD